MTRKYGVKKAGVTIPEGLLELRKTNPDLGGERDEKKHIMNNRHCIQPIQVVVVNSAGQLMNNFE